MKSDVLAKGETYLGDQSIYETAIKPRILNPFNYFDWAKAEVVIGNELDLMFGNKKTPEQAWDDIEKQLIGQLRR